MKRAILIVMDGCGAGEAPDADAFGDHDHPATIRHVWEGTGGFFAPNLREIGFLAACRAPGGEAGVAGDVSWGRMRELSQGKDSVTGHWELMGVITESPFPTYPEGFPDELVKAFEEKIGRPILGNKPASGTAIIEELGLEHVKTGHPIVYTSADSVFQIAAHEQVIPLEQLYEWCRVARELCVAPNNVQRVIARPFVGDSKKGFTRTEHRKDYPLPAPPNLVDQLGDVYGIGVVPELFGGRGFRPTVRTQNNAQHAEALREALKSDARFVFANFEDFDMLYGHRNDPIGFAKALESFDELLGLLRRQLSKEDLLILTADHGNDPTSASTDHSREYVPLCVNRPGGVLGDLEGMNHVAKLVAEHLGL